MTEYIVTVTNRFLINAESPESAKQEVFQRYEIVKRAGTTVKAEVAHYCKAVGCVLPISEDEQLCTYCDSAATMRKKSNDR